MTRINKLTAIPGAFREVDLTPPGWEMNELGYDTASIVRALGDQFPDLASLTIGKRSITIRLYATQELSHVHCVERAQAAKARIFGSDLQRWREELDETDMLEEARDRTIATIERVTGRTL
jgi:hypothetical protein